MAKIQIKYHANIEPLVRHGDWIDLRCAENTWLENGDYRMIPLGVSMKLPDGYEAHVLPRSSTFKNFGIFMVNGMGIIDNDYCGDGDEWKFPAYATRSVIIKKGERIAQFRIVKRMEEVEFETVETLGNEDRGGFGSTGTK